jgi:hypothetical protein
MLWFFERNGRRARVEVDGTTRSFELRVVDSDGVEIIERFADARELASRHEAVVRQLRTRGWSRSTAAWRGPRPIPPGRSGLRSTTPIMEGCARTTSGLPS